jgi:hypothetical protein
MKILSKLKLWSPASRKIELNNYTERGNKLNFLNEDGGHPPYLKSLIYACVQYNKFII